jgi:hypothetical protein
MRIRGDLKHVDPVDPEHYFEQF